MHLLLKWFLSSFAVAAVLIYTAELLKGHHPQAALSFTLFWAMASALVFTMANYQRRKSGRGCATCDSDARPQKRSHHES